MSLVQNLSKYFQHERDHPKMAKPHVPIPMPFAPSNETERRLAVQPLTEIAVHQGR